MKGQKRLVSYQWRLREVMAEHQMFATTELVPLLHERGIDLSASQVHRLVTGTPERLSMAVLAALCDIFATDPSELITTDAANLGVRKTATGEHAPGKTAADLRPKRARITDQP
ncbi:helix-turn-helix domain-containing protein [Kribbella speibonae]|uniref:XRE family transcriptional regulator n=1 Tax=Kribbella speibonae TaxID=1572660 RepID=A0A4R0I658_9ACTN|nr:helix-turn-helix transcriptional regulator [Kribbella speibonae]TCC26464.1 XRE family transcriptional regulator [Kribbella speibonae]